MSYVFVPRREWAVLERTRSVGWTGGIRGQIFHWPGSNLSVFSQQDEIKILNSILRGHLNNGYFDIAYNFAVGRFGHVYELRGAFNQSGAHSPYNTSHEAILLLYGVNEQLPSQMAKTAQEFSADRIKDGVRNQLLTHRETKATQCAGNPAQTFIELLRSGKVVPAPDPKIPPVTQYPSNLLARGDRGAAVTQLQWQLNRFGARLVQDGIFGGATEKAVRAFQSWQGIGVDGVAGPKTFGRLASAIPPKYENVLVKQGSTGRVASIVQFGLAVKGYVVTIDGIFGPKSVKTLKEFQRNNGLSVDGIAGPATFKRLF